MNRKSLFLVTVVYIYASLGSSILFAAEHLSARLFSDFKREHITVGEACELLAEWKIKKEYPSNKYEIQRNIVYYQNGRLIGELDAVVFEKESEQAVLVVEVKCRHNLQKASQHAKKQLKRFSDFREYFIFELKKFHEDLFDICIVTEDGSRTFLLSQFLNPPALRMISQKAPDAKKLGFWTLDFEKSQIIRLVDDYNNLSSIPSEHVLIDDDFS